MIVNYVSGLGPYIEQMIAQKHAVGYPYKTSERVLYMFDRFCAAEFPGANTITPEIGNAWAVIKPTEKTSSFLNRLAPVRELARYMIHTGTEAYVIPGELAPVEAQQHIPHIFSPEELNRFFQAADSQLILPKCRIRHLQIPVIFRLMYTCGLRPHEARLIQKEHLNLLESTIFIPESKGHKDRIVAMSPEMTKICSKYYPYAVREFPNSPYLFPCQRFKGAAYSSGWLTEAFHLCWNTAGLGEVAGNAPRPYDFRHTFATYRLYRWMKEKRELGALLPYLSVYMGHAHFSDTAYYIHLIPDFFSELSGMDLDAYGSLLPEVPHEY